MKPFSLPVVCICIGIFFMLIGLKINSGNKNRSEIIYEEDIVQLNSFVHNINSGGCGYFALKLYDRLDTCRYSLVRIEGLKHVCVYDNEEELYIDSKGSHTLLSIHLWYGEDVEPITKQELEQYVNDHDSWNNKFNWNDTFKIIKYINKL